MSETDIVIIGGGISGLGVALRAGEAGYKVALFEQHTLGGAASANSLRIIHGGFRYLQQLNFARILESISAKKILQEKFPDLVKEQRCIMPLAKFGLKSRIPVGCGALLYNLLNAGGRKARIISNAEAAQAIPLIKELCIHGAVEWYDGTVPDPGALVKELAALIRGQGQLIREHARVDKVEKMDLRFITSVGGESFKSKVVINTSGAWIAEKLKDVRWSKAFNVVLNRSLNIPVGLGMISEEKRLYFFMPRAGVTVIGTAYADFNGDPGNVSISEAEAANFLKGAQSALHSKVELSAVDIEKIEVGVLPKNAGREQIFDNAGSIAVLSTKYTTFLPQADRALKLARKYL
jgi:glycerol-3-phosphate dehydrogenase